MAKQFVVQLKNEPGAMASLAEALAARGVDLRAIGGGSMGDSGHVIMTTADDETARAVLEDGGLVVAPRTVAVAYAVGVLVTVGVHGFGIDENGGVDFGTVGITRIVPQMNRAAEALGIQRTMVTVGN